MKIYLLVICLCCFPIIKAQESISTLNFLQLGAVPKTINERGNNISTSGLAFNITNFNKNKFLRMDATWLVRYLFNSQKDTAVFNDTNKVYGLDMPVFTFTAGRNIIKGDKFSLGIGLNLDSRTFFSSPTQKAKNIIDAFNVGFVIGAKVRIKDWLTYSGIGGYDFMFTDATGNAINGGQIHIQNNFSFLLKGKFGINIQPDISFKSFDTKAFQNAKIVNKNFKVGLAYAIQ
ncbi:MAG: hypothetical protein HQ463_05170 [Bacteroidetes bacterium]|nr:hypothetical protein [Bacteroidota bacterium]